MSALPSSWNVTHLGTVVDVVRGVSYKKPDATNQTGPGLMPILRATNIGEKLMLDDELVFIPDHYVSLEQRLRPGDIIVAASSGSSAVVGKSAILDRPWNGAFGAFCCVIRAKEGVDPRYLSYYLQDRPVRERWSAAARGTNINNLKVSDIESTPIPLAPFAEQRRIVGAIEELFSRIDSGVVALYRARRNLLRMQAAVLQAAAQGRLVPPTSAEAADVTLKRLAAARGDQPDGRKNRKGPQAISLATNLPPLPVGWTWTTVYELRGPDSAPVLTGPFGTTLGRADFKGHGVPLLTIGCLTERGVTLDKALYVTEDKAASLARYCLQSGDLLFSRMATVGRVGVVTEREAGALINYHLMRLRLAQKVLLPDYLAIYIRGSPVVQTYVRAVNHGVTRPGINTTQLLAMPVALPPLDDQQRITEEVERRFSLLDNLEVAVLANTQRSDRLRRAVLSQAFEGRLVPQNSSDEPANFLLDRIKATRTADDSQPHRPRRRSRR